MTKNVLRLYSQYHACWWPGDARSQGIRRCDVNILFLRKKYILQDVGRYDNGIFSKNIWTLHNKG